MMSQNFSSEQLHKNINNYNISGDKSVKRCILVFFETTKLLKEFYNSPYMDIYRNNNELRIMTEEVNPYEKMSIIRQATSPSKC